MCARWHTVISTEIAEALAGKALWPQWWSTAHPLLCGTCLSQQNRGHSWSLPWIVQAAGLKVSWYNKTGYPKPSKKIDHFESCQSWNSLWLGDLTFFKNLICIHIWIDIYIYIYICVIYVYIHIYTYPIFSSLRYAFCWSGTLLSLYLLLEWEARKSVRAGTNFCKHLANHLGPHHAYCTKNNILHH